MDSVVNYSLLSSSTRPIARSSSSAAYYNIKEKGCDVVSHPLCLVILVGIETVNRNLEWVN